MLKVLSWNIQQGGGSRIVNILKTIQEHKATVVIYSEFHNNKSGSTIRNGMYNLGYRHAFFTGAEDALNTVAIFSKLPCGSSIFPKCDVTFPHAMLRVEFEVFDVYGVYFPHKKKHTLFPYLIEQELSNNKPSIIAGDYNTGINGVDQKGSSFWYSEHLIEMDKLGFKDAFRLKNGDVKEYSWFSHQGNGFRYDHTYVSESLSPIIKDCYYDQEARTNKYSDHSPMVLELQ